MLNPLASSLTGAGPSLSRVRTAQQMILSQLMSPARFARLIEQEAIDGEKAYRPVDFLADVRKGIWSEVNGTVAAAPKIDAYRRNLQRAYLDMMNDRLNGRAAVNDDQRPFIRGELRALNADVTKAMARATDRPVAALLKDLKSRGLLDRTLVVWGGEFGRTPVAQGTSTGRDHNPYGFTMWLAGGGIKGGLIHGATDEYGFHAIANKVEVHDLHATMLHQLGIDHKRLTYRFGGRDMRLTDVHGEVVREILA